MLRASTPRADRKEAWARVLGQDTVSPGHDSSLVSSHRHTNASLSTTCRSEGGAGVAGLQGGVAGISPGTHFFTSASSYR